MVDKLTPNVINQYLKKKKKTEIMNPSNKIKNEIMSSLIK